MTGGRTLGAQATLVALSFAIASALPASAIENRVQQCFCLLDRHCFNDDRPVARCSACEWSSSMAATASGPTGLLKR